MAWGSTAKGGIDTVVRERVDEVSARLDTEQESVARQLTGVDESIRDLYAKIAAGGGSGGSGDIDGGVFGEEPLPPETNIDGGVWQ